MGVLEATARQPQLLDPVFGLPSLEPALRAMQVRGALSAARQRYVLLHCGARGVVEMADRLQGEARELLASPPPASRWGTLGPMMDVDRAIVEGPMRGDVKQMRAFGAEIGMYDVSTVYKMMIRLAVTPRHLMRRIVPVFGSYFAPMQGAALREEAPHHVILRVPQALPLYLCEYGVCGWIGAALEMAGAKKPSIEQTACIHRGAEACEWMVRWG